MGREARVIAEIGAWAGEGRLLLETDELVFRGAKRVAIPLADIVGMDVADGWLTVRHGDSESRFDLGDFAEKWMQSIRNPRTLLDKLDVKTSSHVLVMGMSAEFVSEVQARAGALASAIATGDTYDLIFLAGSEPAALDTIPSLREHMKSTGAIWVIHPRGRADLSHDAIMQRARTVGLIDVKSARFNPAHGALKLMLPRAAR